MLLSDSGARPLRNQSKRTTQSGVRVVTLACIVALTLGGMACSDKTDNDTNPTPNSAGNNPSNSSNNSNNSTSSNNATSSNNSTQNGSNNATSSNNNTSPETNNQSTNNQTLPPDCEPEQRRCSDDERQVCVDGQWRSEPCERGESCAAGDCVPPPHCEAGARRCEDNTVQTCNDEGSQWEASTICPTSTICDIEHPDSCRPIEVCRPDEVACVDDTTRGVCSGDGSAWLSQTPCAPSERCFEGACLSPCEQAARLDAPSDIPAHAGCDFWSALLPGAPIAAPALAIQNRWTTPATVRVADYRDVAVELVDEVTFGGHTVRSTVVDAEGNEVEDALTGTLDAVQLPPGGSAVFLLRRILPSSLASRLYPTRTNTWHITADRPVEVSQFGSYCCPDHQTGDSALLSPSKTTDTEHTLVVPTGGYAVIVGTQSNTQLLLELATDQLREPDIDLQVPIGSPIAMRINPFDQLVLNVAGSPADGHDLSGSTILSDKPVAVFVGHHSLQLPNATPTTDHVEARLFVARRVAKQRPTQYPAVAQPKPARLNRACLRQAPRAQRRHDRSVDTPIASYGRAACLRRAQLRRAPLG